MSYKNPNKKRNERNEKNFSIKEGILLIFVALISFVTPFYKGLFNGGQPIFELPILTYCAIGAIALLFIGLIMLKTELKFRNNVLIYMVWLIPCWYLVTSLIEPISTNLARFNTLIYVMYAVLFVTGFILFKNKHYQRWLSEIVFYSGVLIMLFGLINWFGFDDYQDAVYNGNRLTSVFQYPNTYAAYLIGVLMALLVGLVIDNRKTKLFINSLFLTPIIISILLTDSRGALVTLPFIVLSILVFFSLRKQIILLVHLIISAIISLLTYNYVSSLRTETTFLQENVDTAIILLTAASIITAGFIILVELLSKKILSQELLSVGFNKKQLILPFSILILCIIGSLFIFTNDQVRSILPEAVQNKIQKISLTEDSVLSRAYIFKDSIKIANEYPVFGAGGGAYIKITEKFASYPYISRQAHNYYLQLLIETGYVGLIIIVSFIMAVYFFFIKGFFQKHVEHPAAYLYLYAISVSILIHSFIDFDMSYVFIASIVFLSLGCLYSIHDRNSEHASEKTEGTLKSFVQIKKVISVLIIAASVFVFITSVRLVSGNTSFSIANEALKKNDFQAFMTNINKAIDLNGSHAIYSSTKGSVLLSAFNQTKDMKYLQEAEETIGKIAGNELYDKTVFEILYQIYINQNNHEKALQLLKEFLPNVTWDILFYERLLSMQYDLGLKAKNEGKDHTLYWNDAIQTYNEVDSKTKQLLELHPNIVRVRPFHLTQSIIFNTGRIHYLMGNSLKAAEVLQIGVNEKLDTDLSKMIARWYLASLKKINSSDPIVYNKLIGVDPNEVQQIEELVRSQ